MFDKINNLSKSITIQPPSEILSLSICKMGKDFMVE